MSAIEQFRNASKLEKEQLFATQWAVIDALLELDERLRAVEERRWGGIKLPQFTVKYARIKRFMGGHSYFADSLQTVHDFDGRRLPMFGDGSCDTSMTLAEIEAADQDRRTLAEWQAADKEPT